MIQDMTDAALAALVNDARAEMDRRERVTKAREAAERALALLAGALNAPAAVAWRMIAPTGAVTFPGDTVAAPAWQRLADGDEPYRTGDLVTFQGVTWRSVADGANEWSPEEFPQGWERV